MCDNGRRSGLAALLGGLIAVKIVGVGDGIREGDRRKRHRDERQKQHPQPTERAAILRPRRDANSVQWVQGTGYRHLESGDKGFTFALIMIIAGRGSVRRPLHP